MFVRRVALLAACFLVVLIVLGARAWQLTIGQGDALLLASESRLTSERWTPTVRARVLDRKGRVLAMDAPAYDLQVEYALITGTWPMTQAARAARRANRERWGELSVEHREALAREKYPEFAARSERFWVGLARTLEVLPEEIDARRDAIREEVQRVASTVWASRLVSERAARAEATLLDVNDPVAEQAPDALHTIWRGLTGEQANAVARLASEFEGVRLMPAGARTYPFESVAVEIDRSSFPAPMRDENRPVQSVLVRGVATHLLGWMRQVDAEQLKTRPRVDPRTGAVDRGYYEIGDLCGRYGVEEGYEERLRGLRGRVVHRRDTGSEEVEPATPGKDVHLTIDAMLQARLQALLSPEVGLSTVQAFHEGNQGLALPLGTELTGAAVVLDVDSGEILAMASNPSFTRADLAERPERVWSDPVRAPWVNRAIAKPYPPGSIVKPLILCAAVSDGAHSLGAPIECHGHLLENNPGALRCWIYKQNNGTLTHQMQFGRGLYGDEAIAVSCNIYFYTLGRLLGPEKMAEWYRRLGVERAFDLHLGGFAYPGAIGKGLGTSDAIMMGMGQGPVTWTPLHAANAYCTLARGGLEIEPRLVRDEPVITRNLRLDPDAVDTALKGLFDVVHSPYGGARHLSGTDEAIFNAPGVRIWAKTGTADAPPILGADPDGEGPAPPPVLMERGDHSWLVLLVGPEDGLPRYAVAVITEYAGSGSRVSGPIANQVVHALIAEGYL